MCLSVLYGVSNGVKVKESWVTSHLWNTSNVFDAELWSHIQNGGRVSESRGDTQSSIQMRNMREAASIRKGRVYTDCGYIMCCFSQKTNTRSLFTWAAPNSCAIRAVRRSRTSQRSIATDSCIKRRSLIPVGCVNVHLLITKHSKIIRRPAPSTFSRSLANDIFHILLFKYSRNATIVL